MGFKARAARRDRAPRLRARARASSSAARGARPCPVLRALTLLPRLPAASASPATPSLRPLSQDIVAKLGEYAPPIVLPASVSIEDKRLGTLSVVLMLLSLAPLIIILSSEASYMLWEEPSMVPTFWFESSGTDADGATVSIARDMNVTGDLPTYCDNAEYDYYYYADVDSYWNDLSMKCRQYAYGEITKKAGNSWAFITTMIKEVAVTEVPRRARANFAATSARRG